MWFDIVVALGQSRTDLRSHKHRHNADIAAMRDFFTDKPYPLRRIYLFCDSINDPGRRFYEARGSKRAAVIPNFYNYCDAVMYVRDMDGPDVG